MECAYGDGCRRDVGCQFLGQPANWEHANTSFCIFHLPLEAKRDWSENQRLQFKKTVESEVENGRTDFSGTEFPGQDTYIFVAKENPPRQYNFQFCKFDDNVQFSQTGAPGFDFEESIFEGKTSFLNVPLPTSASFRKVVFNGSLNFRSADHASVNHAEALDFAHARFLGEADFQFRWFHTSLSFEGAHFAIAPNFMGCRFPENVSFHGARFKRKALPKTAEARYRFLRKEMRTIGARDYEGLFYALEQKCRTKRYWWPARFPFWFYDVTTSYGRSYERAALSLVAVQLLAFISYYVLLNGQAEYSGAHWKDIAYFTVAQLFKPFEMFSQGAEVSDRIKHLLNDTSVDTIAYIAGTQSLISFGIFGLLLLAIRWRFKRD